MIFRNEVRKTNVVSDDMYILINEVSAGTTRIVLKLLIMNNDNYKKISCSNKLVEVFGIKNKRYKIIENHNLSVMKRHKSFRIIFSRVYGV